MADALLIHRVMMAAEQWERLSWLLLPPKVKNISETLICLYHPMNASK
jgi:hypothetical protein